MAKDFHRAWALLFARLILGLIFFMAGVSKVFQLGPIEHARKYFLPFADTFLPSGHYGWPRDYPVDRLDAGGLSFGFAHTRADAIGSSWIVTSDIS